MQGPIPPLQLPDVTREANAAWTFKAWLEEGEVYFEQDRVSSAQIQQELLLHSPYSPAQPAQQLATDPVSFVWRDESSFLE